MSETVAATMTPAADTAAPVVTIALAADTGVSATDHITSSPALVGTAAPNSTVTITRASRLVTIVNGVPVSGSTLGTVPTDANGAWSLTPSLPDGGYALFAMQTDSAGRTGVGVLGFTLDQTAPALTLQLANNTATAASGGTTADARLSGTGEAGGTVTLTEGGTVLGSMAVGTGGGFGFSPVLSAGPHTLVVSETDVAGNTGTATLSFRLDRPPAIAGTVAGQATTTRGSLRPFATVTLNDADPGATATVGITVLDPSGTATDALGTLSGSGLTKTGTGTYSLAAASAAGATAALAGLLFVPAVGSATPGSPASTRFALSVTDDQGATATDSTTSVTVTAVPGTPVFTGLSAGTAAPAAIVSVAVQLQPAAAGSFFNLGSGTLAADGQTYKASGTASQVNAALFGVTFVPASGQGAPSGISASVGGGVLTNTRSTGTLLQATADGTSLVAGSGPDTLSGGTAAGSVLIAGPGADVVVGSTAGGTLLGGTGSSTFFSTGGPTLIVGGGTSDVIAAIGGAPTVFSATGGRSLIASGAGPAVVAGGGQDTLIGGSGTLLASMAAGSVAFGGGGASSFIAGTGATVVGGTGPLLVGASGAGALVFGGAAPTTFVGGTGSSTVVGGAGGKDMIFAGAGGGVFSGSQGGNNILVGGQGVTTLFGGGSGDALFASGSAGTVLVAGSGNETLQGAGSSGNDNFLLGAGSALVGLGSGQDGILAGSGAATVVAGTGQDLFSVVNGRAGGSLTIIGFKAGTDKVALNGFAANETARSSAAAVVTPGSATAATATTITLSDNTRITFQGMSSPPANLFG